LVEKPDGKRIIIGRARRWKDNLKWNLEKYDAVIWTAFVLLRTETSGKLL
jgi:hypothetical protein